MKIAIVGSRGFPMLTWIQDFVKQLPKDSIIVSGGARGVDQFATWAAKLYGLEVIEIPPRQNDIERVGIKPALLMRNGYIVEAADIVVAFWDGKSTGTADTIRKAQAANKPTTVVYSDLWAFWPTELPRLLKTIYTMDDRLRAEVQS